MATLARKFEHLAEVAERLESEKRALETRLEEVHEKMGKVEDEWLRDHSCSCGLIGVPCVHKEAK